MKDKMCLTCTEQLNLATCWPCCQCVDRSEWELRGEPPLAIIGQGDQRREVKPGDSLLEI